LLDNHFLIILIPTHGYSQFNEGMTMTTITIAYDVSTEKTEAIKSMVDQEQTQNVNFNGEIFTIERGDFTSIDKDDAEYVILLGKVQDIIHGYN
jgi:hypothetical protein